MPRRPHLPLLLSLLLAGACAAPAPVGPLRGPEEAAPSLERDAGVKNGAAEPAQPEDVDAHSTSRVLAHVNGQVVSYRDVLLDLGPELASVVEPAERRALEEQSLLRIVRQRIILQDAREYEVPVERDEFDKARKRRIAELEQNGGTLDAYLAEQGMSRREYDQDIRDAIRTEKYILARIGRSGDRSVRVPPLVDVYVSPAETRAYWDRHPELHRQEAAARVRMLIVRADRSAPDRKAAVEAARVRANDVRQRLAAGEDGAAVWRELNAGAAEPDPEEGLLEMRRGERASWIERFAFAAERGNVSEMVQKGTVFFVMRAEGHHEAHDVEYEERQELIRNLLSRVRWSAARYEVELLLLEKASVQPNEVRRDVRDVLLRGYRRENRIR